MEAKPFAYDPGVILSYNAAWVRRMRGPTCRVLALKTMSDSKADVTRSYLDTFVGSVPSSPTESAELEVVSSAELCKYAVYDVSISGRKSAMVHNPDKDGKIVVEVVTEGGRRVLRSELTSVHGKPVGDAWFGGCSWSHDERYFCYVAQPLKKSSMQGQGTGAGSGGATAAGVNVGEGSRFEYTEDWGEKFVGVAELVLCVLDTESGCCRTVPGVDDGCPGQPLLVSCEGACSLVYTHWSASPRRLGMFTCYHRRSRLVSVDIGPLLRSMNGTDQAAATGPGTVTGSDGGGVHMLHHRCISEGLSIARSPRCCMPYVARGGWQCRLVFVGREAPLLVHNSCWELFAVDINIAADTSGDGVAAVGFVFETPRTVVGLVHDPPLVTAAPPSASDSGSSSCAGGQRGCLHSVQGEEVRPAAPAAGYVLLSERCSMGFPGLYLDQLPRRCFVSPNTVALTSAWGSSDAVLLVNVCGCASCRSSGPGSQHVYRLTAASSSSDLHERYMSRTVLEANNETGTLLCCVSSPTSSPRLALFSLQEREQNQMCSGDVAARWCAQGTWTADATPACLSHCIGSADKAIEDAAALIAIEPKPVHWSVQLFGCPDTSSATGVIPVEAVLIHPARTEATAETRNGDMPVVIVPHGGPHSVFGTGYGVMAPYVYLAMTLQALVVVVNYRGSIGFGQRSIECLPGHIGEKDLQDILSIVDSLKQQQRNLRQQQQQSPAIELPALDFSRLAIVGGSHGGYLAGQAVGQFPDLFCAAVMRNPVTNIPAMYTVSDIPDWCIVESLGLYRNDSHPVEGKAKAKASTYSFESFAPPTASQLTGMFDRSPIRHIDAVVTPTLLLLAAKDRRVPMCQGLEFHHALKARGVATRCMVFPEDTHAIDNPASQRAAWSAVRDWFAKHFAR